MFLVIIQHREFGQMMFHPGKSAMISSLVQTSIFSPQETPFCILYVFPPSYLLLVLIYASFYTYTGMLLRV